MIFFIGVDSLINKALIVKGISDLFNKPNAKAAAGKANIAQPMNPQ